MQRHSQPVGRLLPAHLLDPFDHRAQVVAAGHGGEHAEEKRERESVILRQRPAVAVSRQGASTKDAFGREPGGLESAGDAALDKLQVAPAQAGNAGGGAQMRRGR